MRSFSYFLKSGKGTYGLGHTQLTVDDVYVNNLTFNEEIINPTGAKIAFSPTLGNFSTEYSVQTTRAFYTLVGDLLTFNVSFTNINSLVPTPSQFIINLRLPYGGEVNTPLLIGRTNNFTVDMGFAEMRRGQSIISFYDQSNTRLSNVIVTNGELTLSGSFIVGGLFA